jgi:ethanolamine ammonia-lyase large subunit
MGIPGSDDIRLNYQTTSFHDALYVREVLNKPPAPEFAAWLEKMGIFGKDNRLASGSTLPPPFAHLQDRL